MHDPLTVAFEIRRPWPKRSPSPALSRESVRWRMRLHHTHLPDCKGEPSHRDGAFPWWKPSSYSPFWRLAGRDYYWPSLVTVWHREPGGRDGLTVCGRRVQRPDGTWKFPRTWRWHVHHWRIQVHPLQDLRRRLLTRCAWCNGRDLKGDPVCVSQSWDGPRGHWWQGERGLLHSDCLSVKQAHATCTCERPLLEHATYGRCTSCGRFRPYGINTARLERARQLAALPPGSRLRGAPKAG